MVASADEKLDVAVLIPQKGQLSLALGGLFMQNHLGLSTRQ